MASIYHDKLWGKIDLSEPVLRELVASAPVQRLKHIHQAGASYYILPEERNGTRFEHSLGVVHVLQRLGAGIEEQVAGLLHDVPHTAFSHTIDIVFPNEEHNFHEGYQHDVVMASEIPDILRKYGVPLSAALEPDGFPLLEQPLPNLCADRIDYALRDAFSLGQISKQEAHHFLGHLIPTARGPLVNDCAAARRFAEAFCAANALLWTEIDEAGTYWALAGALRRAYELDAFTDADLFTTDDAAMSKLRAIDDPRIQAYLRLLEPGTRFYEVMSPGRYFVTHMKNRAVNPNVLEPGWKEPRRLSEVDAGFAQRYEDYGRHKTIHYRLWCDRIPPILAEAIPVKEGAG